MGSKSNTIWYAIVSAYVVVLILNLMFFSSFSQPINNNTSHISPNSLDDYLYNYSSRSIPTRPRTGVLYNISLPANFSGMDVSVVRLRRNAFWARGANFSNFGIPPRIITVPFVKRLAILYENFGNMSSHYYDLPGYTFLTQVVGFAMYDATDLRQGTSPKRLNITVTGEPISIKFSQVEVPKGGNAELIKCVGFDPTNGVVELSNVSKSNVCSSKALGHFAIAIPSVASGPTGSPSPAPSLSPMPHSKARKKVGLWKWWVIGFGAGLVGLMVVVSVSAIGYKSIQSGKLRRMEKQAEKSEALDTRWIGNSKMPWASATRTRAANIEPENLET